MGLLTFVLAARVAGLEQGHALQRREARLEPLPDEARKKLAGRVFEPRDLVQVVVIEQVVERLPQSVEVAVIDEPAGFGVNRSLDRQLHFETVPVQARALVAFWHVRQPVRGFEAVLLDEANVHPPSVADFESKTPGFSTPEGSRAPLAAASAR